MKRLFLFLIIFVFLFTPLLKAEEITLTLDEAMAIGLRDNRDILLKSEDVKKAKAKIKEAEAGFLPTLSFTGGWTQTRDYYPNKDIGQTSTQATLKQYLFKGGKTINTLLMNKSKLEVAKAILDKTKLEIILNLKKAFYTLLLANEFSGLNKSISDNSQQHLDSLKERYNNGQVSESDILQIESSLESVRQACESSLNQVESARILLVNLLFLDKGVMIKPNAQLIYEPREIAIDEAILKAMKDRPEIRQYELQENVDKKAIEITKADNRPSIYASWDYYTRSTASLTFSPGKAWNDYSIIGFTFSWPIFDGFATKAKVEQAIVDLKETRLLKEKTINDIALEVKNAYLALKNAIARIASVESDLVLYKDNLATAEEKYQQGITSHLDLNDANLKYSVSVFNEKEALYDYIIAKSSFEKATGGTNVP